MTIITVNDFFFFFAINVIITILLLSSLPRLSIPVDEYIMRVHLYHVKTAEEKIQECSDQRTFTC